MSRLLPELESVLRCLADEHRRLLACVEAQHAAMKAFDLKAMDDARNQQEASRLRVAALENKRRTVVAHIAKRSEARRQGHAHPARRPAPAAPRRAARSCATRSRDSPSRSPRRTHVAGRLSGAVLGHLNTVVRLLAGAVEKAGLYTKHGVPSVSSRIGVMEAVG